MQMSLIGTTLKFTGLLKSKGLLTQILAPAIIGSGKDFLAPAIIGSGKAPCRAEDVIS